MQLLHMYCLKHNMQGGAAHTLLHCHDVAFMVHSHRCELSTVAWAPVPNKQKHTSMRIEYKMKTNNQFFWCWNRNIPWESGQYHSCWRPGPLLRREDISSYAIDYVDKRDSDKNTHVINLDKLKWKLSKVWAKHWIMSWLVPCLVPGNQVIRC